MKVVLTALLIVCMASGCTAQAPLLDQALALRKRVLAAEECSFSATVTADYETESFTFQLDCTADAAGELRFTVTAPETISGITGSLSQREAALTFDGKVLAFPALADGQLTPVSTPWIFLSTLRSGYLTGCGKAGEGACIYIDDSYQENPLHLQIYTDQNFVPTRVEIVWENQRILSADILNFTLR